MQGRSLAPSVSVPVLLFARCRAAKLSSEEVSTRVGTPPKKFTEIESGTLPMQSIDADKVAAWIHVLRAIHRRHGGNTKTEPGTDQIGWRTPASLRPTM